MKVIIPKMQEHAGYPGNAIEVEISDLCPVCGGERGKPYDTISYDGSRRLHVNGWKNPCGHVDKYSDVRQEALMMANGLKSATPSPLPETETGEDVPEKVTIQQDGEDWCIYDESGHLVEDGFDDEESAKTYASELGYNVVDLIHVTPPTPGNEREGERQTILSQYEMYIEYCDTMIESKVMPIHFVQWRELNHLPHL